MSNIKKGRYPTDNEIIKFIKDNPNKWNLTTISNALGIHRHTLALRKSKNPKLKAVIDHMNETRLDFAENKLDAAVAKGNIVAIIFLLKTLGKARGYVEKQETEITTPNQIETIRLVEYVKEDSGIVGSDS
jgi:hypothetical protein